MANAECRMSNGGFASLSHFDYKANALLRHSISSFFLFLYLIKLAALLRRVNFLASGWAET